MIEEPTRPWYRLLTRYHWFVLAVAAMGWLFDCLDQQLFVLARPGAMRELLPKTFDKIENLDELIKVYSNYATSIFLAGWATGGLFFGVLGDRIGRAKTMLITILMYSLCTGLSALAQNFWQFAGFRFLTGLGVGGEFAVGVALVAEVMPARARPYTLAALQAFSAFGNITAALIALGLGVAEEGGLVGADGSVVRYAPWKIMFVIGALPALLAVAIRAGLKEPEAWQKASHDDAVARQLGSYRALFGDRRWRRNALVGLALACSGVIGLWAVGFFIPDLTRLVLRAEVARQVYEEQIAKAGDDSARIAQLKELQALEATKESPASEELAEMKKSVEPIISGRLSRWQSYSSIGINVGAFFGMFGFGAVAQRIGRKPTFAIGFLLAFISTAAVCWFLRDFWQVFVLVPIMGFCQLSLFAGYAMYFPELFPTRLRSTGTSFCYNVGRFVAASGPLIQAQLLQAFAKEGGESLRYAGLVMCTVFILGLFVLPFAPETKGQPLPE
jgi:MFS family permease